MNSNSLEYKTAVVRFSPVILEWNLAQTLLVFSRRFMLVGMGNNPCSGCLSFSLNLINNWKSLKSFNDSSFWWLTPSLMDIMIELQNLSVFCLCFFAPVTVFNAWPLERPCSIKTSIGLWKHLCMNTKVISKSIWKKRISWLRIVTLLTQIKKWTGQLSALYSFLVHYFAELMVIRTKVRMLSL